MEHYEKQYERLSRATRNLEQEYTRHLVVNYSERVSQLNMLIDSLRQEVSNSEESRGKFEDSRNKLEESKSRCKDLERKIENLLREKSEMEGKLEAAEEKIENLQKKLNKIVASELRNENANSVCEETILKELRSNHDETVKLIRQINKKIPDTKVAEDGQTGIYQGKIKALESEIEDLKSKNSLLSRNERTIKEQKDSIVLLKDSIEGKEKTIQSQKSQIEMLNKQIEKMHNNPFEVDFIDGKSDNMVSTGVIAVQQKENKINTVDSKNTISDPWALKIPREPPLSKKAKKNAKTVNVENIIREDNKSFFNDLSFSNSSPVVEKSFRKAFK
ncbi:uncharacterized protein VICG_01777 [Vittaforma corneae ATCC 50505]|uniref:Uncharacterized protein n=1 Tax=Vittaforma corneae (strain ATCC 50505) TaxID=993615 RepID=L2GJX6_VITCO|nr:uncharacterized protein VICG_01777 [Vittaforma corneae ATCC 50505]ELA41178.1 hypothetical protein VICG_01777 [Vittaforma corneae ATCC 50505]